MNRIDAVLDRLQYGAATEPNEASLRALQKAFLLNVPFENLDIQLGRRISIESDAVFDKLVKRRRGGFCYECNGLFAELLEALGFQVQRVSARMARSLTEFGNEFDHLALLVDLGERWLVDVGNGRSCREPLPLRPEVRSRAEGIEYRIEAYEDGHVLAYRSDESPFTPRFRFSTQPRRMEEFAGGCHFHQTSPLSVFTHGRMATLATEQGRLSLTGNTLTVLKGTQTHSRELAEHEVPAQLLESFGIQLDR